MEKKFEVRLLSSLSKVLAKEKLEDAEYTKGSALAGEVYSFQLAYFSNIIIKDISVAVDCQTLKNITVRKVGLAPCEMPSGAFDDNYISKEPGMFPDPLFEIDENGIKALPMQWRSIWITVNVPENTTAETHKIIVSLKKEKEPEINISKTFELEIIPVKLPEQKLVHVEWFHTDCIATHHNVEIFCEKHWELIEKYAANASAHGINAILTPLFTPPLDTKVGGERPTVQLVDVKKKGEKYSFDFSKLERWLDMLFRNGVKYAEFSHLFTQWGAKHAPKIIATTDDGTKKIFGWETDAAGEEYKDFLRQFLPELVKLIKERKMENKCIFHISDEPSVDHMDAYKNAVETVKPFIGEFLIIDALSNVEFYDAGLVAHPVPGNNHIEPFMERKIENLWTYYCCSQTQKVPNRFFAMPSARNRILGFLLFKYDLAGFLHWGFNFWFSQYSIEEIDPYKVTDAGQAFPSGDAFLVYPGDDKPVDSLRHEVMREALQDLRTLRLLEEKIGREKTLAFLEEGLEKELKMDDYPQSAEWLLETREKLNRKLA
jgi:hypothetical protein